MHSRQILNKINFKSILNSLDYLNDEELMTVIALSDVILRERIYFNNEIDKDILDSLFDERD